MENNYAKPVSSTQVNYGENYYTPPPIYQSNNDFDSSSTQISSYYEPPRVDNDAMKAAQAENRDQSGMYVHTLPGVETEKEVLVYHLYSDQDVSKIDLSKVQSCDSCEACLKEKRRRQEEKKQKEMEDCCSQCLAECCIACCIGCIEGAVRRD